MSISSRLVYVQARDLIDEETPQRRGPRFRLSRRRQLGVLLLAAIGLSLLTLLLDRSKPDLSASANRRGSGSDKVMLGSRVTIATL